MLLWLGPRGFGGQIAAGQLPKGWLRGPRVPLADPDLPKATSLGSLLKDNSPASPKAVPHVPVSGDPYLLFL